MTARNLGVFALAAAFGLAPFASHAATIDFRSSAFAGADYATGFSTTVGGVTTTLAPEPTGAKLYWDSTDGIGVRFDYEADEIEGVERLAVSFSTPIQVTQIMLTDLFFESGYLETGWYQIDDGAQTWFSADASQLPRLDQRREVPGAEPDGQHDPLRRARARPRPEPRVLGRARDLLAAGLEPGPRAHERPALRGRRHRDRLGRAAPLGSYGARRGLSPRHPFYARLRLAARFAAAGTPLPRSLRGASIAARS